jgi:uncharacterized protein (DUF1800 family)
MVIDMKSRNFFAHKSLGAARSFVALLSMVSMLAATFTVGALAEQKQKSDAKRLTEDQKIIHVLNRLGFGARPGDVEKVRAIGVEKYIEQQLNPNGINDSVADAKVQNLEALKMTTAQLFEKYPNPGALLNFLGRRNQLPPELKDSYKARQEGKAPEKSEQEKKDSEMKDSDAMKSQPQQPGQQGEMTQEEQRRARQEMQEYLRANGLKTPREMISDIYASRILRAVYSERQLQETMVDFWTNHFNVFVGKGADPWYLISYDRDTVRPNTMGKFKDLLLATAKSPAMLFYLDNFESVSPNANIGNGRGGIGNGNQRLQRAIQNGQLNGQMRERIKQQTGMTDEQINQRMTQMQQQPQQQQRMRRGINENYAREIMELHTLGVDGGYTQKDIQEVARCFTGWTIADPRGYRKAAAKELVGMDAQGRGLRGPFGMETGESGEFVFNPRLHDDGEKVVLGQKISSGGGINDGLKVIEILSKHPSTAKFVAKKLAVKFVNDNPSKELVDRVAAAFTKSDGDIRATLKALFASPEFFAVGNYRAKIKTPLELTISSIRVLGGETNGGPGLNAMLAKMGEQLYGWQAPTGYPDQAEDWVNTGALLERLNFGIALASNRIPGTRVDLSKITGKSNGVDRDKVLGQSIAYILNGEISEATKATLMKQIDQPLPEPQTTQNNKGQMENVMAQNVGGVGGGRGGVGQQRLLAPSGNPEVVKIVGLVLGSPEFQRQ